MNAIFISSEPVKALISWESSTVPELCRSVRGEAFPQEFTHGEVTAFIKDVSRHARQELLSVLSCNLNAIKEKPLRVMPCMNAPTDFEGQITELKTRLSENTDLLDACLDRLQRQLKFATDNSRTHAAVQSVFGRRDVHGCGGFAWQVDDR